MITISTKNWIKKNLITNIVFLIFIFLFFSFSGVFAAEIDLKYLPPDVGQSPVSFVAWFYSFALGLVGIAVFGVIIYGAILHTVSAGNASKQADAKEWITAAIWGLLLLLAAYLILYTINEDIVDLNKIQGFLEKKIESVQTTPFQAGGAGGGGGGGGGGTFGGKGGEGGWEESGCGDDEMFVITGAGGEGHCQPKSNGGGQKIDDGGVVASGSLSEEDARSVLDHYNIQTKSPCPSGQTEGCVNFNGMKEETMAEIVILSNKVGSQNVFISGGTEGKHKDGVYNHSNGYKFDVRPNSQLDDYIVKNYEFIGKRGDDGADQYKSPSGAIYAKEGNHWDVLVK